MRTEFVKKNGVHNAALVDGMTVDSRGFVTIDGDVFGTLTFGSKTIASKNSIAGVGFVARYTGPGSFPWALQLPEAHVNNGVNLDPPPGVEGNGTYLQVDGSGNTYLVGQYRGTVDLDPGPGTVLRTSTTAGGGDGFVLSLSGLLASGLLRRAHRILTRHD